MTENFQKNTLIFFKICGSDKKKFNLIIDSWRSPHIWKNIKINGNLNIRFLKLFMSASFRIIAKIDIKNTSVIKGINFEGMRRLETQRICIKLFSKKN